MPNLSDPSSLLVSEAQLLPLAYAFEQVSAARRPPRFQPTASARL